MTLQKSLFVLRFLFAALFMLPVLFFCHCMCDEGGGSKDYDFEENLCEDIIDAINACNVTFEDPLWTDMREACEGEYRPFFECLAEQHELSDDCADWLVRFNAECKN